jgi:signal transduction histidine kinase
MKKTIIETCHIHLSNHPDVKKIKLKIDLPEQTQNTPHNANDMIRVISNLVINAAQASKENDLVTLKLEFKPDFCEINVVDQGSGISKDIQQSIFLPGFTSKPKGNGLGLYSCQNIIEKMHKGTISFTSEEGKGTEFTIRLPTT